MPGMAGSGLPPSVPSGAVPSGAPASGAPAGQNAAMEAMMRSMLGGMPAAPGSASGQPAREVGIGPNSSDGAEVC